MATPPTTYSINLRVTEASGPRVAAELHINGVLLGTFNTSLDDYLALACTLSLGAGRCGPHRTSVEHQGPMVEHVDNLLTQEWIR